MKTQPSAPPATAEVTRAAETRRAILEAMPEAVTIFSPDGIILDFKGAADVPIPMAPADLIGMSLLDMPHVPAAQIRALIDRAFETRETQHLEYEAIVDGVARVREATLRAISAQEALWVVRDVTQQRENWRRLSFTDRLVSLGTLAAGVAHEINNPLGAVLGNLEIVAQNPNLGEHDRVAIADALASVDRIIEIVAGLKLFSRPAEESGGVTELERALHAALKMASREVSERAKLEVDIASNATVRGSETKLVQVLVNLLLNAAQAFDPEQRARNLVTVRVSEREGRAMVEIADNGPGIPAAAQARIFEPFYTTKPTGTGLGLAISLQIVRACGGELEVESVVGRGTVFRVMLSTTERPARPSLAVPRAKDHRARVLIVDDDRGMRNAIGRMLAQNHLTAVESVPEALAAIERDTFDLVLCDVRMPGRTGVDFFVEVASRWPGREATVVLMTGGGLTDAQRVAIAPWSPQVLHKPFTLAAIAPLLETGA